jgi:drug/metabolite transporter (DMT)-like permease
MTAFLPILVIVVSVSVYQIGQKLLPAGINPWHAVVIPLGIWLFKEKLTLENIVGIVLCLGGLVLIAKH